MTSAPDESPLVQGNLKAAAQLYLARQLPVHDAALDRRLPQRTSHDVDLAMIAGVLAVNLAFVVVGYALLGRTRWHWSWAGLALLVGAGAVGTVVFLAAIVGLHASLWVAAVVALGLVTLGLVGVRGSEPLARPGGRVGPLTGGLFGLVVAVCLLGIVGGFRSSPWLDDAWGIWLPKGLALWHHGLDERLFVPNGEFVTFGVPDYPLWWSVVSSLDVQAVGDVDVRVDVRPARAPDCGLRRRGRAAALGTCTAERARGRPRAPRPVP